MSLDGRVRAGFAAAFGGRPDGVARAPGRVNLIGEHTDYNEGFVLPIAIAAETRVAFRARPDRLIRVSARDIGGEEDAFSLQDTDAGGRTGGWRDYVRGTIGALQKAGLTLGGVELAIAGDLPRGSGLSSSASLEVAVGLAVTAAAGKKVSPLVLAQAGQRAENDLAGVRCGIMDQLASAASTSGAATLIDCRSLSVRHVPFSTAVAVGIVQSGVARGLVDGHYNQRRTECEEAARALGLSALRDATLDQLESSRNVLPDTIYRRARHVVSENARVLAASIALAAGKFTELGRLMAESHASMRDDFEITVSAVDRLAAVAQAAVIASAEGRGGARMTGGGFGGAVVIVAPHDRMKAIADHIAKDFRRPDGLDCVVTTTRPTSGANLT